MTEPQTMDDVRRGRSHAESVAKALKETADCVLQGDDHRALMREAAATIRALLSETQSRNAVADTSNAKPSR